MLNKYNLIVKNFTADKGSIRPELSGIYISPKETVATDSFMLVRVQTPKVDINEFPVVQKGKKPLKKFEPFILPQGEAEKLLKLIPTDPTLPILNNVALMKQTKKIVKFATSDLQGTSFLESRVIEGDYPNYKEILPKKGRHINITINSQFLKKIALFANEFMQGYSHSEIELECPVEKNAPLRFICKRGKEDEEQKAEILLMPIKQE